ncbi:hypothetical protein FFI89_027385 [Bradyrhizobium sp. KBS0727]|nr:hypothetical protein [Bradyrhizobium sp. KBS0725]QDW40520.1 hypothetical protein FFI71_027390 [Bradyrhizobium sp. KBS0725]QDW47125.1 hypothetical protein FFI89_027385 [Bradyrhizobium sp. KBS0727]
MQVDEPSILMLILMPIVPPPLAAASLSHDFRANPHECGRSIAQLALDKDRLYILQAQEMGDLNTRRTRADRAELSTSMRVGSAAIGVDADEDADAGKSQAVMKERWVAPFQISISSIF